MGVWSTIKRWRGICATWGSPRAVRQGLSDYFAFYTYRRPHQALAYQTPAVAYAEQEGAKRNQVTQPSVHITGAGVGTN